MDLNLDSEAQGKRGKWGKWGKRPDDRKGHVPCRAKTASVALAVDSHPVQDKPAAHSLQTSHLRRHSSFANTVKTFQDCVLILQSFKHLQTVANETIVDIYKEFVLENPHLFLPKLQLLPFLKLQRLHCGPSQWQRAPLRAAFPFVCLF